MKETDFNHWCRQHSIHILNTDKRAYRWTKKNVKFFQKHDDYNVVYQDDPRMETEPLYTIEMMKKLKIIKISQFLNYFSNKPFLSVRPELIHSSEGAASRCYSILGKESLFLLIFHT